MALLACRDGSLSLLPLLSGSMFLAECPRTRDPTAPPVTWNIWIWLCMAPPGEMGSCRGHLTLEADSTGQPVSLPPCDLREATWAT